MVFPWPIFLVVCMLVFLKPILGMLETIRLSFSFPRRVVVPFDSVLSLIVCPLVDTTK